MTRLQAAAFIVAFGLAVGVSLAIGMLVMFVRFEIQARLEKRRARRNVESLRRLIGQGALTVNQARTINSLPGIAERDRRRHRLALSRRYSA